MRSSGPQRSGLVVPTGVVEQERRPARFGTRVANFVVCVLALVCLTSAGFIRQSESLTGICQLLSPELTFKSICVFEKKTENTA